MPLKKKNKVTFLKAASITPFTEKEKNARKKNESLSPINSSLDTWARRAVICDTGRSKDGADSREAGWRQSRKTLLVG